MNVSGTGLKPQYKAFSDSSVKCVDTCRVGRIALALLIKEVCLSLCDRFSGPATKA